MEPERQAPRQAAGLLVCHGYDYLVSGIVYFQLHGGVVTHSIALRSHGFARVKSLWILSWWVFLLRGRIAAYLAVRSSQPSPKVAIVRFRRGMQQGLLGRISRSAVKEYHAFGIISFVQPSL